MDDCTAKLDRAQKLIGGLGGERDRWSLASDRLGGDIKVRLPFLQRQHRPLLHATRAPSSSATSSSSLPLPSSAQNVTGDVLIASGVISYMGPFTSDFRERIVRTWIDESCRRKVPTATWHSPRPRPPRGTTPGLSAATSLPDGHVAPSLPDRHVALLCRCRARTSSRCGRCSATR